VSRTLIDAVERFVADVAPALAEATGDAAEDARRRALGEAHDLVAGFIDADAHHTDAEIRGYLTAVGPWIDPRLAEATVGEVRAAGLLAGARARLQEPGEVFDELLRADRRDHGLRAWVFKQRAMELGHEVAALDMRTSPGEVDAIGRFRRRCHAAIVQAGVARPSERRPDGGFFVGQDQAGDTPAPATGLSGARGVASPGAGDGQRPTREPSGVPVAPEVVADGDRAERTQVRPVDEVLDELDELIGLDPVKAEVSLIADLLLVQRMRAERGMPTVPGARHLVFTGNPGTGKTTVARLVAEIYAGLGVVARGHLIETDRSGLVAGYAGQTAQRTREVVHSAKGGVLLIDEAYALAREGQDGGYGREAVDTLVKLMEDHRHDLVVIVAGYPDEMSTFLESNPGLASRFPRTIHFPDYETAELAAIAQHIAAAHHYRFDDAALRALRDHLTAHAGADGFGNARAVRNAFEAAVARQAARVVVEEAPSDETLMTLTASDVDQALADVT
jgi:AAA+ superfamily predicted ATPase